MKEFEQIAVRINSKEEYKKSKKLFLKLGYKNDKKWNELYIDKICGVIKYNLGFESGMFSLQSSCVNFKTFKSIKEFKEYVKSKEPKKGKLTIIVSKNYKELYEDNLALVNHILLDTVKNDEEWIEKVQKYNLNITLYTDKNDTELFKKSFDKFEVKLMDSEELVSGWYKYKDTKYLMYHNFETNTKFGFGKNGDWYSRMTANDSIMEGCVLATYEKVEERLKEEAVKRGFDKNNFKSLVVNNENDKVLDVKDWYFEKYNNTLYSNRLNNGGKVVFNDGIWAEIVEELTLKNIQVDCSDLTTEQIKEMKRVVVDNGFKLWDDTIAFEIIGDAKYFQYNTGTFCILINNNDLTIITYDKFMELFDTKIVMDNGSTISNVKEGEVKSIEEDEFYKVLKEKLESHCIDIGWTDMIGQIPSHIFDTLKFRTLQGRSMLKVDSNQVNTNHNLKPKQYRIGIDTFERAKANLTTKEYLACLKFGIDKYTWREKDQDIEDFEKIIAYANEAINVLKSKK